jgi:hypothetical protein
MTYTINGKEYTEFDINKRCAELMEVSVLVRQAPMGNYLLRESEGHGGLSRYSPCNNPSDTDAIIDKCWDELNESILRNGGRRKSHWQDTMQQHNCTKLIAACICYIELNE